MYVCAALRRDPAHVAALEVSCLHCLKEVVVLCRWIWQQRAQPKLAASQLVMHRHSHIIGQTDTDDKAYQAECASCSPDWPCLVCLLHPCLFECEDAGL